LKSWGGEDSQTLMLKGWKRTQNPQEEGAQTSPKREEERVPDLKIGLCGKKKRDIIVLFWRKRNTRDPFAEEKERNYSYQKKAKKGARMEARGK